ncbi:GNAT family N-acetyltransferase [Niallia sp. 01092]|uniref:GNAT family N-acetyltransferase n=1 Tax=unclassified Niallia TaxID=2837522 RepID=UPI003FD13982
MLEDYKVISRLPTYEEYRKLCVSVGWDYMNFEIAKEAIENSVFAVIVVYKEEVVGMARIVGDGKMYFYFQDIVVSPEHQKKGVGKKLMNQLFIYLKENAPIPAFIGLFATKEGAGLYEKFGFKEPPDMNGMFRLTPIE